MPHSIFLIDDNEMVREALTVLIEGEPDLVICGVSETAVEAIELVARISPDLILVDFSLPRMSGVEFIGRLRILRPQQCVAVISAHTEPICADQAIAAGARGYILKQDASGLLGGIRRVLEGEVYVSPSVRSHVSPRSVSDR